jgi:hypothetical protein
MRVSFLALVFAIAIAGFATQYGTATKSETLSLQTIDVMKLQMQADKNLPEMEMGDLV